ncbi:hypothetical protein [Phyllobacterium bourgognense]|uniref:Uncharacterized protein n=1 Tax=Phyllobacterium bourgognense TaxID=314236 RepID=A0A368Z551_9HYPH|nr:hypothetical protein [Phyllobacterium bourgognense]RCW87572.1 hypothetical protein C7476_101338 [Phyllobacterium bourgognense]
MSIDVEVRKDNDLIEVLNNRPIRELPDGGFGIVYKKRVYAVYASARVFFIDMSESGYEKVHCRVVDVELALARPPIIANLPTMSIERLADVYQNCRSFIQRAGPNDDMEASHCIIEAIRLEWIARGAFYDSTSDAFVWPSGHAINGNGQLTTKNWLEVGLLGYAGYRVGATSDLTSSARQRILDNVLAQPVPTVFSIKYRNEWGDTGSCTRLWKMAESIAAFMRNARRRNGSSEAVRDWQTDLNYLKDRYYFSSGCAFAWPSIDDYVADRGTL